MRVFLHQAALVVAALWANAAFADMDTSREWFGRLTADERVSIQTDLVLLGYYDKIIDGAFGAGTFTALEKHQIQIGEVPTGVLSDDAIRSLREQGDAVSDRMGLEFVEDERSQTALLVPREVVQTQTDNDNGLDFKAEDESVSLSTFGYQDSAVSFRSLFETLILEAPGVREVTYKFFSPDRLVVSGTLGNMSTYLLARYSAGMIRGFSITWRPERDSDASVVAMLNASFSMPLETHRERQPPVEQPAPTLPGGPTSQAVTAALQGFQLDHMGALAVIRDNDNVLVLDGEIASSTPLELLRALKERPAAKYLLLNSPGGLVDAGLLMAHEVRERGLTTVVPRGFECVSACSFVFFAGRDRLAVGSLGVHQVWNQANDLISGQEKLSDVLEALSEFGVDQQIISVMLRTPPQEMHIFDDREKARLSVNSIEAASGLTLDGYPPHANAEATAPDVSASPIGSDDALKVAIQAALDNYQQALNLAADGDHLSAETYRRNAVTRLQSLCSGAGFPDIPSCIGSDLPPLPSDQNDDQGQSFRDALEDKVKQARGYVQLATQPTKADALVSARELQAHLGTSLPGPLSVMDVDLGDKGVWYRIVLEVGSYQQAIAQCAALKATGTQCVAFNWP